MSFKKQKTAVLVCSVFLLAIPFFALAAGLVPCGSNGENPCNVQDIFAMVARVTNWLIMVAGIYAVFQMVFAGFNLVTSLGEEEKITKNTKALQNAVVGFVLVMAAYIFINMAVNYILLGNLPASSPLKVDLTDPLKYLKK